jgi:hypothetical protein
MRQGGNRGGRLLVGVKVEICEDCEALLQLERVDITVRMGRMEWGVVRAEPDRSSSDVYELAQRAL